MGKHRSYHLGVKGLIRDKKGKILLLYKSADRSEKFGREPTWDLPGGRVEEGASIAETLRKEVREETGIEQFENKGLFHAFVSNYEFKDIDRGLILFVYEVIPTNRFEIELNDEYTEFGWFETQEAARLLNKKYPADFVEKIRNLN